LSFWLVLAGSFLLSRPSGRSLAQSIARTLVCLGYVLRPLLLLDPFMASFIEASAGRYDQSTTR
jgi:hypothetical protein